VREWPWADYVDEELSKNLLGYSERVRDISANLYYDSDDGAAKAQLVLSRRHLSDEPAVRIRVTTSSHKFGSRVDVITDAGPLTKELCLRRHGRELSPDPEGGWSFVADVPGLSSARIRRVRIMGASKTTALWVLMLGYVAFGVSPTGIWSGMARRFLLPCSRHEMCSPGFCDRGRCMSVARDGASMFGAECGAVAACGEFVCIDGRCSSCEKSEECTSKPGENVSCNRWSTRRRCDALEPYAGP
jgi:hypothetical protein